MQIRKTRKKARLEQNKNRVFKLHTTGLEMLRYLRAKQGVNHPIFIRKQGGTIPDRVEGNSDSGLPTLTFETSHEKYDAKKVFGLLNEGTETDNPIQAKMEKDLITAGTSPELAALVTGDMTLRKVSLGGKEFLEHISAWPMDSVICARFYPGKTPEELGDEPRAAGSLILTPGNMLQNIVKIEISHHPKMHLSLKEALVKLLFQKKLFKAGDKTPSRTARLEE